MSADPQRFAFSKLINVLKNYDNSVQVSICRVLSKLVVTTDPSESMSRVAGLFCQRIFLMESMVTRKGDFGLTPAQLLKSCQMMMGFERDYVRDIIGKPADTWESFCQMVVNDMESGRPKLL